MVIVNSGSEEYYLDENLKKNLDDVKDSVINKGWDYFEVIAGIPGVGKSTLAQAICKYLDPEFSVNDIYFGAETYIQGSTEKGSGKANMLDESFADLNTQLSRDPKFIKLINHTQLVRQKGQFHILVLPDFFSLSKNIAIFRTSHLFVVYADNYERGRFAAFGRDSKRELYIKGKQFVNYQAINPNFRGRFVKKWVVDEETYKKRKMEHLQQQSKAEETKTKASIQRDKLVAYCHHILNMDTKKLSEIMKMPPTTLYESIHRHEEEILTRYGNKQ